MKPWCKMFATWMVMCILPFYGDIFSASAQMSVKTGIPLITSIIGLS